MWDVVYTLPLLGEAYPTKRAPLIGIMAATLARSLNDQQSRAWYCRLLWDAWTAENEGRAGLQALATQIERLDIDRREWKSLRNPAARGCFMIRITRCKVKGFHKRRDRKADFWKCRHFSGIKGLVLGRNQVEICLPIPKCHSQHDIRHFRF